MTPIHALERPAGTKFLDAAFSVAQLPVQRRQLRTQAENRQVHRPASPGAAMGFRGVAGFANGTNVTLMATTADNEGNPDSLAVVLVDNGSATPPPVSVVVTTPPNQVFRGVALTPQ